MNNHQNKNQPINNGLTPKPSETHINTVPLINIPHTQSGSCFSSYNLSVKKLEDPIKPNLLIDSVRDYVSNTGSSDTLKDAVRKWHAKRKKDPTGNDETRKSNKLTKGPGIMLLNEKNRQQETKPTENKNNYEGSVLITNVSQEQKRQRSNTEIEKDIKSPFDGPLSFDTIMALKKKKSEAEYDETNERNMNSLNNESTKNEVASDIQTRKIVSFSPRTNYEINSIRKKIMTIVNNFQSCNTYNELTHVFVDIINSLSANIEEIVQKQTWENEEEEHIKLRSSLELCIRIVSQKSDNVAEELDEIALNFLAKYPAIFESLKTLTNIESLNELVPDAIHEYILKYVNQIDRINDNIRTSY